MKFKYDGKSRPSNKAYDDNYNRIFKKDHDKFSRLQQEQRDLDASYQQSKLNKQERIFGENQDDVKHDHVNKDRATNKKDTNENKN